MADQRGVFTLDPTEGTVYLTLPRGLNSVWHSEVDPGATVTLDYDGDGNLTGVEIVFGKSGDTLMLSGAPAKAKKVVEELEDD